MLYEKERRDLDVFGQFNELSERLKQSFISIQTSIFIINTTIMS